MTETTAATRGLLTGHFAGLGARGEIVDLPAGQEDGYFAQEFAIPVDENGQPGEDDADRAAELSLNAPVLPLVAPAGDVEAAPAVEATAPVADPPGV